MTILRNIAIAFVFSAAALSFAGTEAKPSAGSSALGVAPNEVNERWMVEGEKRYRTNCGRCHQPPHKLSPREMATAVRHMRVRAMLTEDDMKYVLYYVTH
jgi:mono/diheme cytochrome c family protein